MLIASTLPAYVFAKTPVRETTLEPQTTLKPSLVLVPQQTLLPKTTEPSR